MALDTLFLLRHQFSDGPAHNYYCPDCAMIEGVLAYYPAVRQQLNVRYADFQRPRPEVVERLGSENQSCPVLILDPSSQPAGDVPVQTANGQRFIAGWRGIAAYLHDRYDAGQPH
jgi:hypothetical protein